MSQTRLFHHLANANQKEDLFPKSCTEVKAERRFLPKVQQSLDRATGKKYTFVFYLMDFCKWRGRPVMVYLLWTVRVPRALAWFWTLSSVCVCTVAAATPLPSVPRRLLKSHGITSQESRMYRLDSVMWSVLILTTQGDPVEKDTFVWLMYRTSHHVVKNRNHLTGIRLTVAFNFVCLSYLVSSWCHYCFSPWCTWTKVRSGFCTYRADQEGFSFLAAMPSFLGLLVLSFKELLLDKSLCARMTYH